MTWLEKHQPSPLDENPPAGLFYLDGDAIARRYKRDWAVGFKYPMIAFPSGTEFSIWAGEKPIIHLYGEMDLPLRTSRDAAFERAFDIAEQCGYLAGPVGENQLEVWGRDAGEHFLITFDNGQEMIVDVEQLA